MRGSGLWVAMLAMSSIGGPASGDLPIQGSMVSPGKGESGWDLMSDGERRGKARRRGHNSGTQARRAWKRRRRSGRGGRRR